jgi:hypothetical protein
LVYFPNLKNPRFFSNGFAASCPSMCANLVSSKSTHLCIMMEEGIHSILIANSFCCTPRHPWRHRTARIFCIK